MKFLTTEVKAGIERKVSKFRNNWKQGIEVALCFPKCGLCMFLTLLLMLFGSIDLVLPSQLSTKTSKSDRHGIPPSSANNCPPTHPITVSFTT